MNYLRTYADTQPIKFYTSENSRIPVFLHIPKCAGTYTLSLVRELLRMHSYLTYQEAPIKHIISFDIVFKNLAYLKIFALDAKKAFRPYDQEHSYTADFDEFLEFYNSGGLSIFAIATTSQLLSAKKQEDLFKLLEILGKEFVFFTNLRTPYSRAYSMYKVHKRLKHTLPSLTLNHDEQSIEEFSNFLTSADSEPWWISIYLSYVFQKPQGELIEFVNKSVHSAYFLNALDQLRFIFGGVYGDSLANFLDFIPDQALHFNLGTGSRLYIPESLDPEVLENYRTLHSRDIDLLKKMLPALPYDVTGSCYTEELFHA